MKLTKKTYTVVLATMVMLAVLLFLNGCLMSIAALALVAMSLVAIRQDTERFNPEEKTNDDGMHEGAKKWWFYRVLSLVSFAVSVLTFIVALLIDVLF